MIVLALFGILSHLHICRIIILIAVRILKPGAEVNRALGQPKQFELVCVPIGSEGLVPLAPWTIVGILGGGAGGASGNCPGGGGRGYSRGNSANNQQPQSYRSGKVHNSLCTKLVYRFIGTLLLVPALFQVVPPCMELAPMNQI